MVLAVVGTMKAGKSTTINAIVGREILPNRNRPMTALPTLIEHKPGQKTPVLRFAKNQPIQDLIERLKEAAHSFQSEELQAKLDGDRHLQDALENLRKTRTIAETYEGEEGIFHFLAWLNDLVRLSAALEVPFPFEAYTGVGDFPRIEVEFFHLRNQAEMGQGKFTILDTPGFNEADQSQHLLPMMQEQLRKATTVLAVLDYTQLKSDSEKDLRDQLNAIAIQSKGRMFALVNKFDTKKSNSDNAEQTREYVAKKLLADAGIPAENIFPVSSLRAYLAQRAKLALADGGIQWQSGQDASWVDDFGEEAMGWKWQQCIADADEVQEAAGDLWNKSKFDEPLENVIHFGYRNAALQAVAAAASVLNIYAQELRRYIRGRRQTHQAAPEQLQSLIEEAKEQIDWLRRKHRTTLRELEEEFAATRDDIGKKIAGAENNAETKFKELLEKGEINLVDLYRPEIEKIVEMQKWRKFYADSDIRRRIDGWMEELPDDLEKCTVLMNALRKANSFYDIEEMEQFFKCDREANVFAAFAKDIFFRKVKTRNARIKMYAQLAKHKEKDEMQLVFKDKETATKVLEEISGHAREILDSTEYFVKNKIKDRAEELEIRLSGVRNEIEERVVSFSEKSKSINLDALVFESPAYVTQKFEFVPEANYDGLIGEKTETRVIRKEQAGTWGGFKRAIDWFDWGWGFDEEEVEEKYPKINIKEMNDHWIEVVASALRELRNQVENDIMQPLNKSCDDFFNQVQSCFEQVQKIMQDGLRDQNVQMQLLLNIRHELENLQQQFGTSDEDAETLDKWASRQSENHAAASLQ